jgi:hypothetical protein
MLEANVKAAFEKVKAGFGLPIDVHLNIYKTREEAENALGRKVEPHEFAFADYNHGNPSVTFIQDFWPLKNHSRKKECLEGVIAEDFGHIKYDSTHKDLTAVHVDPELSMHVYQFWAVRNGIESGFGDPLLEFYKIATTKTKPVANADVGEIIGVFPALAALSEKYDVKQVIAKYIQSLPRETRKEVEKYTFLLDAKSYDNESDLLVDWKSAKRSS